MPRESSTFECQLISQRDSPDVDPDTTRLKTFGRHFDDRGNLFSTTNLSFFFIFLGVDLAISFRFLDYSEGSSDPSRFC